VGGGRILLNMKCLFRIFLKLPHSEKNSATYYHKCTCVGIRMKYPFLCQILKANFFSTDSPKILKYQVS